MAFVTGRPGGDNGGRSRSLSIPSSLKSLRSAGSATSTKRKRSTKSSVMGPSAKGFVGKFKRAKRNGRANRIRTNQMRAGVTRKFEGGNTITDADAVYVGHSTGAGNEVLKLAFMQLTKDLVTKAGWTLASWEEPPPVDSLSYTFAFTFWTGEQDQTLGNSSTALPTFDGSTVKWFNWFDTIINAVASVFSVTSQKHIFQQCRITNSLGVTLAQINMKDYSLIMSLYSKLTIQNRTKAGTTGAPEGSIEEVTNNPLNGKLYLGKGNTFVPAWRRSGTTGYPGMIANRDNGTISVTANEFDSGPAGVSNDTVKEMPSLNFFGVSKGAQQKLLPGQLKHHTLRTSTTIGWNRLMSLLQQQVVNLGVDFQVNGLFSKALFGFEKMLNDRSGTENSILVAYEVNATYKCHSKYRPKQLTVQFYEDKGAV